MLVPSAFMQSLAAIVSQNYGAGKYDRAYKTLRIAIDCLLTAFLFCFVGFYNGIGRTRFVMIQGICGAFGMRVPLSFLFSKMEPVSLFRIGLATPCSTILQIAMCLVFLIYVRKKVK